MDEKLLNILYKKALGYKTEEVQEEFVNEEGRLELVKRKVSVKNVPPDISAAKIYLEFTENNSLNDMTDDELETEKKRLLKLLKEEEEINENRKK